MKRAIISQYNQLQEKYMSQISMLNYYYMNLCIKAEEASLLPVKVQIEGEVMNLEKAATVGKKNDYEFLVIPNYEDDLPHIAEGITMVHPEFKQSIEKMTLDATEEDPEDTEVECLLLTMPEVDDDRHDFLRDTVNAMYDDCKLHMEAAYAQASAEIATLLEGESEQTVNKVKQAMETLQKDRNSQRDQMRDDKLKEIEDAYLKWLAAYGQQEIARMEEEDAHGNNAGKSMSWNKQ